MVIALALTEHDVWTAVNHGLTGTSTGGFTVIIDPCPVCSKPPA